jgi:rod shape-determining protein MreC
MVRPDISSRARYLLFAVVVGHVLLISAQVGTNAGPSLLRTAIVGLVTRLQEGSWFVVGSVRSVVGGYASLRGVRADNARLTGEVTDLRARLQEARTHAAGADDMRALLDLRPRLPWTTTGADVVAGSISPDFQSVTIDKGLGEGVRQEMPVIARGGVVGRVVQAAGHTAIVQFVIDRSAAVACRVERSGTEGIALGNGDGTLRLEYLSATADVRQDDLVATSGIDGIYPPDLSLGHIEQVERAGSAFTRVIIRAAVDFSRLEHVLVLLSPRPVEAPPAPVPDVKRAR